MNTVSKESKKKTNKLSISATIGPHQANEQQYLLHSILNLWLYSPTLLVTVISAKRLTHAAFPQQWDQRLFWVRILSIFAQFNNFGISGRCKSVGIILPYLIFSSKSGSVLPAGLDGTFPIFLAPFLR